MHGGHNQHHICSHHTVHSSAQHACVVRGGYGNPQLSVPAARRRSARLLLDAPIAWHGHARPCSHAAQATCSAPPLLVMNARCHRDAIGQQQPSNSGVSIVESIGFTLSCNACDTHKDGVCRESSVNAWWVAWAVMRVQKVAMIACQQGSSLEQPHTHVCKHAAAAQHRTITGLSFDAPAPNQPLWQQLHSLPWAPQLHTRGAECVRGPKEGIPAPSARRPACPGCQRRVF